MFALGPRQHRNLSLAFRAAGTDAGTDALMLAPYRSQLGAGAACRRFIAYL